jgi:DNA primase catalytic core
MSITRDTIAELNRLAADFYADCLAHNEAARAYLRDRGLSDETVTYWQLGYAPGDGMSLLRHLRDKGWNEATMTEAGLIASREGRAFDQQRDRYEFPILDRDGRRVLGFSGRRVGNDEKVPKYVNSPGTLLFEKRKTVYGWPNHEAISSAGEVFVVEGNVDMLALWNAGVHNVVALCGTALTSDILYGLGELSPKITLVLDADSPGQTATFESLTAEGASEFDLGVIPISGGKDPAEILRTDPGAWAGLVAGRRSRWRHLWIATLAPFEATLETDVEQRVAWKDAWAKLVREQAIDRDEGAKLLIEMGRRLHIDETTLMNEYLGDKAPALPARDEVLLVALANDWAARGAYAPYLPLDGAASTLRDEWVVANAAALTPRLRRRAALATEIEVARVWNAALRVDASPRLRSALGDATRAALGGDQAAIEQTHSLRALVAGLDAATIKITPKAPASLQTAGHSAQV